MAWFILQTGAPRGPLRYIPPGSLIHFTLKHPRNEVCRRGDACLRPAVMLLSFSCRPPFRCFLLPKDGFRINFPNVFKCLYKSPGPAAAGFSCRAACRHHRSLHLGLGVAFFRGRGGIQPGLALDLMCRRRAHPRSRGSIPSASVIPPGDTSRAWETCGFFFLQILPPPPRPSCILHPRWCFGVFEVLSVTLILQEFSAGKMLGRFPGPACSLPAPCPLLEPGYCFLGGWWYQWGLSPKGRRGGVSVVAGATP